jgi:hypothetical protein
MGDAPTRTRGAVRASVVSMKSRGVVNQPEDRHRTRTPDLPFLGERDIMKVTNIDEVTWDFKWDRRVYIIKPGEMGFVPFPAVVMRLGDPRSVEGAMTRFRTENGEQGIIPTRHECLRTLYALYAIENEDLDALVDFAPKVEVRTMEEDELVRFPVQNPQMIPWPVEQAPTPGRENSDQRRMMDSMAEDNRAMRDELNDLRSMLSERLGGQQPAAEDLDDPDPLAAALMGGATPDSGPSTAFG